MLKPPRPNTKKRKKKDSPPESTEEKLSNEKFDPKAFLPEEWLNAPGADFDERCERFTLTCMYYLPVMVTFGLTTVLTTFYVTCFLLPSLNGDFTVLGINDYWANTAERDADMQTAFVLAIIFGFCILSLVTAILLTMCTDPGRVPQDKEFDAPDNQELADILQ